MPGGQPFQPPFASTVSAEARAVMEPMRNGKTVPEFTVALLRNPLTRKAVRLAAASNLKPLNKARAKRFGVEVTKGKIAGVPVKFVRPQDADPAGKRLLINFHGGGFLLDAGTQTETIPIAGLTGITTIAVEYRLAPEHPYPAAVDDALAVYVEALKTAAPQSIGIYGTSAGAILTLQLLARIKAEGLPMPAAGGVFSGAGDLSQPGDCEGYLPSIMGELASPAVLDAYCTDTPRTDPLLSPNYSDLSGLPPMMLMSSTRDQLLSHTILTDLALRQAGVEVDLRVYEGMAHAFWAWIECPESEIALRAQAGFFVKHLKP